MSNTVVALPLDERSVLVSIETKSALSRTQRRVLTRVLINPGQGCQRLLLTRGLTTTQVSTVLATRCDSNSLSGLPGIYFAMSDVGAGTLSVRGPNGTVAICDQWRAFVKRKHPNLEAKDQESEVGDMARLESNKSNDGLFIIVSISLKPCKKPRHAKEGGVCIWCMLDSKQTSSKSTESISENSSLDDDMSSLSSSSSGASKSESNNNGEEEDDSRLLTPLNLESTTLCYLLKVTDGPTVAVIDCARESDVDLVEQNPHLGFGCVKHRPTLIVHLAKKELVHSKQYQNWCSMEHFQVSKQIFFCELGLNHGKYVKSERLAMEWKQLVPQYFSSIAATTTSENNKRNEQRWIAHGLNGKFEQEEEQQIVNACVEDGEDDNFHVFERNRSSSSTQTPTVVPISEALSKYMRLDPNEIELDENENKEMSVKQRCFPRVSFLGTGAAKPSTFRGLSSILVQMDETKSILLDAGEDVLYQLRLICTNDFDSVVDSLKAVWISHHHLDHHGGLVAVVDEKLKRNQSLFVFAPQTIRSFLDHAFGPCDLLKHFSPDQAPQVMPDTFYNTCRVEHCFDAFAVSVHASKSLILAYSGDTRPCPNKLRSLRPAIDSSHKFVLIHEATFGDDKIEEAKSKRHSTLNESVRVATALKVDLLITTHASQRYPKGMVWDSAKLSDPFPTIQAMDLMSIDLGDFPKAIHDAFQFQKMQSAFLSGNSSKT